MCAPPVPRGWEHGRWCIDTPCKTPYCRCLPWPHSSFPVLVGGTVIIEEIFQLPGVGRLLLGSITTRDYNIVQAVVMTMIGMILMVNLIVDLLYPVVDPRIRYR